MRLKDKVAIVTGAGRGLGQGIAYRFAREGADVAIADIDVEAAMNTAEEVRRLGRRALAIQADVSKSDHVRRMLHQTVEALGAVHILVNNAAVPGMRHLLDLDEQEWDRLMSVNLKGVYLCTREVARYWVERKIKGKIINISSVAAEQASRGRSHYVTAKGGVKMFTRAAALDLAPYGINVNAIGPGGVKTDFDGRDWNDPELMKAFLARIPLGRYGGPDEIGAAAAFLASEDADFITGQTLYVEGGRTISL